MTRLVPDQPTDHAICWLCSHNFSVELHIDRADPDQPLAAELAKAHPAMSGVAKVYEVANRLPTRADDIAAMLQSLGIKGRLRDPEDCPVAKLFRLFAHPMDNVIVDSDSLIRVGGWVIEAPAAVDAFACMFDQECYPELIDRPAIEARS